MAYRNYAPAEEFADSDSDEEFMFTAKPNTSQAPDNYSNLTSSDNNVGFIEYHGLSFRL